MAQRITFVAPRRLDGSRNPQWLQKFWGQAITQRTIPSYRDIGDATAVREAVLRVECLRCTGVEVTDARLRIAKECLRDIIGKVERRSSSRITRDAKAKLSSDPICEFSVEGDKLFPMDLLTLYLAGEVLMGPEWFQAQVAKRRERVETNLTKARYDEWNRDILERLTQDPNGLSKLLRKSTLELERLRGSRPGEGGIDRLLAQLGVQVYRRTSRGARRHTPSRRQEAPRTP